MLIYNTTYHVEEADARNFLIWIKECYLPEVEQNGTLKAPRISRVLTHQEGGECFSVQFEVESSAELHRWHTEQGARLNGEMMRTFEDKIVGFPTLMEVVL